MPDLVDTVIEDDRWDAVGLHDLAERSARATLERRDLSPERFEIALLGTNDERIAVLNADFRGKPQPTNVLSWPAEDLAASTDGAAPNSPARPTVHGPAMLGDIALAWETCEREALAAGRPMADHVTHLVVHGTLHLLGYDHVRDGDATLMERLEIEILARLGVANPYS